MQNADSTCKRINKGIYITDFYCQCQNEYHWDSNLRKCKLSSKLCSKSYEEGGCFREGLVLEGKDCLEPNEDPNDTSKIFCYCRPQYGGRLCDKKKNGCTEKIFNQFVSGIVACGDDEGFLFLLKNHTDFFKAYTDTLFVGRGTCHVRNSNNFGYYCECLSNRASDAGVGYPNCYQLTDACNKFEIQCYRGQCTSTPDGSRAYCKCDPGFIGHDCKTALPTWLSWSEWDQSSCTPVCGSVRIKVRIRKCGSTIFYRGQQMTCLGDSRQERSCEVKYCR